MPSTKGKDEEEEGVVGDREEGGVGGGKGTTFGPQEITRLLGVLGKWGSDQPAPQLLACTPYNPPISG